MRATKICVMGAGIGGLTASLALQRRGFKVSVFERATELREVGAGILVTPNAQRALEHLGVAEQVRADASSEPFGHYARYDTGEILVSTDARTVIEKHGYGILQVHRGDLHAILKAAVLANDPAAIHAGHELVDVTQADGRVTASFKNGSSVQCDVLVGADGNASRVRSAVFGDEPPKFTGQVAMRAMIPAEAVPASLVGREKVMYFGPQRMVLHYSLRKGRLMNLIAIGRTPRWEEEGWAIPATVEEFLELYGDFNQPVLDLIAAIPPGALSKWGLRDREPVAEWSKGRVTLLGDAAHPVTPFLGQGANIAMEDGFVLGRAFDESSSVEEALRRYEAARKERGTMVQLMSREQGEALQRSTPGRPPADRGLFEYDPVNVPI
jgi:salicylate hydroxylase